VSAIKEAIINLIMVMKKKEKYLYQIASSRSDYFQSITRTVTFFQRTLFRERTSKENQHGYIFPVCINFPNVLPPLAPGAKEYLSQGISIRQEK
jgi:hypothetical protein